MIVSIELKERDGGGEVGLVDTETNEFAGDFNRLRGKSFFAYFGEGKQRRTLINAGGNFSQSIDRLLDTIRNEIQNRKLE